MKNGVILNKLQSLEETLNELRSLGKITATQLSGEWRTRRAVERDLQIIMVNNRLHDFVFFREEVLHYDKSGNSS